MMDPNKTLADIRAAHSAWLNGTVDYDALMDNIAALDDWLSKGGFLPKDWQHRSQYPEMVTKEPARNPCTSERRLLGGQ